MKVVTTIVAVMAGMCSASAYGSFANPWDYAVFGISGIGSNANGMGGSIKGGIASAGDIYLRSVSLDGSQSDHAAWARGSFNLQSGTVFGSILSQQGAHIQSANVKGPLMVGASLTGSSATITGATTIGDQNLSTNHIKGELSFGVPRLEGDLGSVASYFLGVNQFVAQSKSNTGYTEEWGTLQIKASSGMNIIDITALALDQAHTVNVLAPSDASIIFRVSGEKVSLDSLNWKFNGGADSSQVLLSFYEAETLALRGGHDVSMLAPLADATFSGRLTGSLIADTVTGGGSIVGRSMSVPVPSPAGVAFFTLAAAGIILHRRR